MQRIALNLNELSTKDFWQQRLAKLGLSGGGPKQNLQVGLGFGFAVVLVRFVQRTQLK
jgi:hypothetical protein